MYLFYKCTDPACEFSAHVSGSPTELDILMSQEHVCPKCKRILKNSNTFTGYYKRKVLKLGFKEFYGAVNGMGLPEETVTHKEPVVAMLRACQIINVDADEVDGRCIINSVTLDNGVTLHFAASGYGAAVFKATRGEDYASIWSKRKNIKQPVRGREFTEKHCPRSCGDTSNGSQVHRRVRKDADSPHDNGERTAVPAFGGYQSESEGYTKVVRPAIKREDWWSRSESKKEESKDEDTK